MSELTHQARDLSKKVEEYINDNRHREHEKRRMVGGH